MRASWEGVDLARLARGDKPAWDAFVERASPIVYAAINKLLLAYRGRVDDWDAGEVFQSVFLRLVNDNFRVLKAYDPARSSMSTWLTLVTRSATVDYLRKLGPATVALDDERHDAPAAATRALAAPLSLPEGLLTPRQELVLQLLFERDLAVEEVARLLGVDEQTVRSTKHKALSRLRDHMGGPGGAAR
jgi:RNA polymerase sigma-70 factor (ECF subfamily)